MRQGDSGSWVVDQQTGHVYGHLIASDNWGGAYVAPLHDTFAEIRKHFSSAIISLPTAEEVSVKASAKQEYEDKHDNSDSTSMFERDTGNASKSRDAFGVKQENDPLHPANNGSAIATMNVGYKTQYDLFRVCKLEDPARDIRIIKSITGDNQLELSLDIQRIQKDDSRPKFSYNALSWCWRSPSDEVSKLEPLMIVYKTRKYNFDVSRNLADALRTLKDRPDPLWVDWICIDQKNTEERNNQVQLMSAIYGEANCVYVWLGSHSAESKTAFEFIPELLKIDQFPRLVDDSTVHHKWRALKDLMMRDWFSRRWIIQEIALAHQATLLCGDSELDWKEFADAVSLFNLYETETRAISKIMMDQIDYDYQPDYFGSIPALGAARLVEVTDHLFEPGGGANAGRGRQQSLEYLVSTFTPFNASEARDTIYAILAIAKDSTPRTESQLKDAYQALEKIDVAEVEMTSPKFVENLRTFAAIVNKHSASKPYHVDYNLPISDVYADFVHFSIEQAKMQDPTRALDILCRPWAPDPDFPLSSDRLNAKHGHWRSAFGWKKGYDGGYEENPLKNARAEQSPRKEIRLLNAYRLSSEPDEITGQIKIMLEDQNNGPFRLERSRDTIPSWTPSTARASFAWNKDTGEHRKMTRKQADLLVGDPSQRIYSASGRRGVTRRLRFEDGIIEDPQHDDINNTHYHSIFVEGFVLGTVDELRERSQSGQIPEGWADLIPTSSGQSDTPTNFWLRPGSEDFWRTLVGDRGIGTPNPPRCIGRILSCHYTGLMDLDLKETIFYSKHQPAASFSRHIHGTIWNRRLMRMTKAVNDSEIDDFIAESHIGLAPDDAKTGDLVVILFGCSVPVILRRYEKTDSVLQSQILQQKARAAQRILTWWRGVKQALELQEIAKKLEDRENRRAFASTDVPQLQTAERSWPTVKHTNSGKRTNKRKATVDHDRATDASTRTTKRLRSRVYTEPVTPTQPHPPPVESPYQARRPQMIREVQDQHPPPVHDEKVFYRLIGECYVHRMMRGEAIEHQTVRRLPSVLFEIR